ncbi:MAG: cysteine desulfurase family protein [Chlamydiales bacterium]|nr:cysteine desulfurase family protein [Chlamydiales bacterium]
MKRVYLDNHTAARPSLQVVKEMTPYLRDHFALLSSPYNLAGDQMGAVELAYQSLYELLGAKDKDTVLFCSSGAEAINHVLLSTYLDSTRRSGKNHYITSLVDEASIIMGMNRLESNGVAAKLCEVDSFGCVTKQKLIEAISPRTSIISLSYANGLTGVIQPVEDIAALCKERGILLHLDVTHVLGKLFFDLEEVGADFISFNGDSLHAPRGCGALYIRASARLSPLIVGAQEQAGKRAGSVNVAGLVGFGIAAKELLDHRDLMCTEIARLRDRFEDRILEEVPESKVFFQEQARLPNCTAVAFPGVFNESLLYLLSKKSVYATIGGGNFQNIAQVLKVCGIEDFLANSTISFSLSRDTTEEEIDLAVDAIVESVKYLRSISKGLI